MDTIGIMFTSSYRNGHAPTLGDVLESRDAEGWTNYAGWLVVAYDPHVLSYADDDREAMDETNYCAIIDALCLDRKTLPRYDNAYVSFWPEATYAARNAAYNAQFDDEVREVNAFTMDAYLKGNHGSQRVLVVNGDAPIRADDPEGDTMADVCASLLNSIGDYALLDEEAYSAREFEAWCEYEPMAIGDEVRDVVSAIEADDDIPERVRDAYVNAVESIPGMVWSLASRMTDYNYGFSGDYGPKFLHIIRDTMGREPAPFGAWSDRSPVEMRDAMGNAARVATVLHVLDRYADVLR